MRGETRFTAYDGLVFRGGEVLGGGGGEDAVADQEGIDCRILAAEALVKDGGVLCAAALEDVGAEGVGRRTVEDAVLFEFGESVGVKHLGPFVGVVSGGVSPGEDVAELGRMHRSFNIGEDAHLLDCGALEGRGVVDRGGDGVPCHVGVSESELAHAGVGGSELRGFHDFLNKVGGNFLAGLVVLGEGVEELLLSQVVFVELRGEFHEVAVDACAGE